MLKSQITAMNPGRDVFLDSDNLKDLNRLFDVVRDDTVAIILLLSKQLLLRPWCVGEITTAYLNHVPMELIEFSDYEPPTDKVPPGRGRAEPTPRRECKAVT